VPAHAPNAMLGGVRRYAAGGLENFDEDAEHDRRGFGVAPGRFGIHQFYQRDALSKPEQQAFSAIDRSTDQLLMGILLEYTLRMGVDTHLVSLASSIPPWQEMRWLTPEEMIAWNVDNTHRRYTDLVLHAFDRSGSYVEVSNLFGADASYLRMFCMTNVKEPLFAFVTDHSFQEPFSPGMSIEIKKAEAVVRNLLGVLNISLQLGSDKLPDTAFQIQDVQGIVQGKDTVRVFAVVRAIGFVRQDAERLTRVALVDNGNLGRLLWKFQDWVKFRIQGDPRLIRLAMKNCVDSRAQISPRSSSIGTRSGSPPP
jgi:hypothetical protein